MNFNENKKKALTTYINDHFDGQMSHFPYAKYPTEPLELWLRQFSDPSTVRPETIREALFWRCGFWQRTDAPYTQKQPVRGLD
ncbi:hypothetical protein GCM10008013_03180 [Paenibacillus segetis]|uniref:Uncharacterized protein n=1 Tax=Paenibacillus segetis TaxID=1325360 RepID=A0ABQ1Y3K5_9BACL|nr:hypothetical protein GCM10008013_03180 [Paenibacillus segetis]